MPVGQIRTRQGGVVAVPPSQVGFPHWHVPGPLFPLPPLFLHGNKISLPYRLTGIVAVIGMVISRRIWSRSLRG